VIRVVVEILILYSREPDLKSPIMLYERKSDLPGN